MDGWISYMDRSSRSDRCIKWMFLLDGSTGFKEHIVWLNQISRSKGYFQWIDGLG